MSILTSLFMRIRQVLACLTPPGQSTELVKHTIERLVPVKGRLVRVRETYYAPSDLSASAHTGDNDV